MVLNFSVFFAKKNSFPSMFVDFISVFCYNLAVTASCKKYRKKRKEKKEICNLSTKTFAAQIRESLLA
jgi:hypothetical protein